MHILSLRECHEYGWQIADLFYFLVKHHDEEWFDPEPIESIRKIARTQDPSAITRTRAYLRSRLLAQKPQRRYNPDLENIIDSTLQIYLFGDEMPLSARAARIQDQLDEKRAREFNTISYNFSLELEGTPIEEVRPLLRLLVDKHAMGYAKDDLVQPMISALERVTLDYTNQEAFLDQLKSASSSSPVIPVLLKKLNEYNQGPFTEVTRTKTLIVSQDPKNPKNNNKVILYLSKQTDPQNYFRILVSPDDSSVLTREPEKLADFAGGEKWVPALSQFLCDFSKSLKSH